MNSIQQSSEQRSDSRNIHLHYEGGTAEHHFIAAGQLANSINSLRRTVELTALEAQGIELRERDRLPTELQRRFGLYISAPTQGSLGIDAVIGEPGTEKEGDSVIADIASKFNGAWQALSGGDWETLNQLFPDRLRLHRWIDAAKRVVPKSSGDLSLTLKIADSRFDLSGLAERIEEFRDQKSDRRRQSQINGYLAKIDFLGHGFNLRLPENQRLINGSYAPEAEEFLLANPRELIRVTGLIVFDQTGVPLEVSDATDFELVDLSPIEIHQVPLPTGVLKALTPIEIPITLDETEQLLEVEYERLDMNLCAESRDDLEALVREDLAVLWLNLASAEGASLTSRALAIKNRMLETWREENYAT